VDEGWGVRWGITSVTSVVMYWLVCFVGSLGGWESMVVCVGSVVGGWPVVGGVMFGGGEGSVLVLGGLGEEGEVGQGVCCRGSGCRI